MNQRKLLYVAVCILLVATILVWINVYLSSGSKLTVAFLDIGQGDSIFIESPTGNQVLIDGGPISSKVLTELGKVMPFGDKSLDLIIGTHPDADHIGGLPVVLDRYEVSAVLEPGVIQTKPTQIYQTFEQKIDAENAQEIISKRGQVLDLGGGVMLSVLYPDRDVSHSKDTNSGSVVARLSFGEICFILTGDAPISVEQIILNNNENIECEVLKVGHHGSRTSTSASFLEAVNPMYAIISAGKNNRYGHPHKEVISQLTKTSTTIISTAERGTIIFETDGQDVTIK